MSNHWSGLANVPGTVVLVVAIADISHIITYVVVSVFICFMGLIIWGMVDANLRRIRAGQSSAQLLKAAEQLAAERLRKDVEEWSLPPELNLPTPRRVRSAPLGARLLRSLPRIIFLTVLAIFIYAVAFLYTHVIPAARDECPHLSFSGVPNNGPRFLASSLVATVDALAQRDLLGHRRVERLA